MEWVRVALRDTGNDLVGRPGMFASAVPRIRSSRGVRSRDGTTAGEGLAVFRSWVEDIAGSPRRHAVSARSRLGVLEQEVAEVAIVLHSRQAQATARTVEVRNRHLERVMTERGHMRQAIGRARLALESVSSQVPEIDRAFVEDCVTETRKNLGPYPDGSAIHLDLKAALERYAATVNAAIVGVQPKVDHPESDETGKARRARVDPGQSGEAPSDDAGTRHESVDGAGVGSDRSRAAGPGSASDALAGLLSAAGISLEPFSLVKLIFRMDVDPALDPASRMGVDVGDFLTRIVDGGKSGREAGAAIGGWIGKHVLGEDAEADTVQRIEHMAREVLESVRAEADRYLAAARSSLDDAEARSETSMPSPPELDEAEAAERDLFALLQWSEGLSRAVRSAAETSTDAMA